MTDPRRDDFDDLEFSRPRSRPLAIVLAILVGMGAAALLFFSFGPRAGEVPSWVPEPPPPPPMAHVELRSTPPGAKVYLEEGKVPLAVTPNVVTLFPGSHTLRFELPGFEIKRVTLDTTKDTAIEATWDGVLVTLRSNPDGAVLYLDGKPLHQAPFTMAFPRSDKPQEIRAKIEGFPERLFVFQPTQDIDYQFDFTAASEPSSAPASAQLANPLPAPGDPLKAPHR